MAVAVAALAFAAGFYNWLLLQPQQEKYQPNTPQVFAK
jgi:uncharacterized membrane protein